MEEVIFSPEAYCKMIMHAAKYPHCAVNGVLLAESVSNEKKTIITYSDAIPLFHVCLNVTPMSEIALSYISQWAKSNGKTIAGFYMANENVNDTSIEKPSSRIADKINEKFPSSTLVIIDNKLVTLTQAEPAIKVFSNTDGKWRQLNNSILTVSDDILETTSNLLIQKIHYELVDFDNHLDNISLQWKNQSIDEKIREDIVSK